MPTSAAPGSAGARLPARVPCIAPMLTQVVQAVGGEKEEWAMWASQHAEVRITPLMLPAAGSEPETTSDACGDGIHACRRHPTGIPQALRRHLPFPPAQEPVGPIHMD